MNFIHRVITSRDNFDTLRDEIIIIIIIIISKDTPNLGVQEVEVMV